MLQIFKYRTVILLSILASTNLFVLVIDSSSANNANLKQTDAFRNAIQLYQKENYSSAAACFEDIIKTVSPEATLYYYAALANQQSGRTIRADQLFKYIESNFPNTQECAYAHKILLDKSLAAKSQKISQNSELPESVKNLLSKDMQALLNTEEGKRTVQEALKQQGTKVQVIKEAEKKGAFGRSPSGAAPIKGDITGRVEHPFTAADIARDGANGIDQGKNPNCWFEASIAALAQLTRGQGLLADTIRYRQNNKYVVRFHNDGVEYIVTAEDLLKNRINDKARWASIIECAELKKFPDNAGANGVDNDQSRLEIGLGCITGRKAEVISPQNCNIQELASFIGGAVKSYPIVAATFGESHLANLPEIIVPSHAYTVIDFDPSKNMVTVRNPHGRKSEFFKLPRNAEGIEFQQFDDGLIKIGLSTFQKYFHSIARSFI